MTAGHLLIIPNRHVPTISLTAEDKTAFWLMVDGGKKFWMNALSPDGYNVGINIGADAGQTIMHCHIHLIPRRSAMPVNPRGGVRGVIARPIIREADERGA